MPCHVFFTLVLGMMTMVRSMSEQVLGLIVSDLTCIFCAHLCCSDFLGYFGFFFLSLVICKFLLWSSLPDAVVVHMSCQSPFWDRTKALFLLLCKVSEDASGLVAV
jgi:hypothetical protein